MTADHSFHPGVAGVLSLVIPGAGQIYRGDVGVGLLWLAAVVTGYVLFIIPGLILHVICVITATQTRHQAPLPELPSIDTTPLVEPRGIGWTVLVLFVLASVAYIVLAVWLMP